MAEAANSKKTSSPSQKATEMNDTIKKQAETALNQGKAVMDQMSAKSREAMEQGAKTAEEVNTLVRGNFDTFVDSGRVAAKGFEHIAQSAMDFARENAEATSDAARSFASAKNANELIQLQSEFARGRFDRLVAEGSKMTEMMVKLSGEIFEPISNRMAVAADGFAKAAAR